MSARTSGRAVAAAFLLHGSLACAPADPLPPPRLANGELFNAPQGTALPPPPLAPLAAECIPYFIGSAHANGISKSLVFRDGSQSPTPCPPVRSLEIRLRADMVLQVGSPKGWVHGVPSREGSEWNLRWWTSKPTRMKTISPFVVQTRGATAVLDWSVDLQDGTSVFRSDLSGK